MRPVTPHINDRGELRLVESDEHPAAADVVNGALTAGLLSGGVAAALVAANAVLGVVPA
jgi:hypothetical protein